MQSLNFWPFHAPLQHPQPVHPGQPQPRRPKLQPVHRHDGPAWHHQKRTLALHLDQILGLSVRPSSCRGLVKVTRHLQLELTTSFPTHVSYHTLGETAIGESLISVTLFRQNYGVDVGGGG